jgi:hypothetical protein
MDAPRANFAYTSVARLRAEGFQTPAQSPSGLSDARLRDLIRFASTLVNQVTRQWFQPAYSGSRKTSGTGETYFIDRTYIPILDIRTLTYKSGNILPDRGVTMSDALLNRVFDVDTQLRTGTFEILEPDRRIVHFVGDLFVDPFVFGSRFAEGANNVELDGWFGWLEDENRFAFISLDSVSPINTVPADGTQYTLRWDHRAETTLGEPRPEDSLTIHRASDFAKHTGLRVIDVDLDPSLEVLASGVVDSFEVSSIHPGADFLVSQIAPNPGMTLSVTLGGTVLGGTGLVVTPPASPGDPYTVVADCESGITPVFGGGPGIGLVDTLAADPVLAPFFVFTAPGTIGGAAVDTALPPTPTSPIPAPQLGLRKLAGGQVTFEIILAPGPSTVSEVVVDDSTPGITNVTVYSDPVAPFTVATMLAALAVDAVDVLVAEQISGSPSDVVDTVLPITDLPYASLVYEPVRKGEPAIPAGGLVHGFGRTPEAIEMATIRLINKFRFGAGTANGASGDIESRVIAETTDNYSYRLADPTQSTGRAGSGTGDSTVDLLLTAYRRPPLALSV